MNRHETQKGAVLVEVALTFLIFLVLSIGLFEMARGMWIYTTLSHAARQGARFAIVHGASNPVSDTDIADVVKKHAIGLAPSDITVTVNWEDPATKLGGDHVLVRATYPIRFVTGAVFISQGDNLTLGAQSEMTISY